MELMYAGIGLGAVIAGIGLACYLELKGEAELIKACDDGGKSND